MGQAVLIASEHQTQNHTVSTVRPDRSSATIFAKTCPLHASLEQRHATPSFYQQRQVSRKLIRNKSLEQMNVIKVAICLHVLLFNEIDHNELICQE